MFCSHCGKKVGDAMLFCPFCGAEIVIPEQEDEARPGMEDSAPVTVETSPAGEPAPEAAVDAKAPEAEAPPSDDAKDAAAELLDWNLERLDSMDAWARRDDEPTEPFEPLKLDEAEAPAGDWRAEISRKKETAAPEKKPPRMRRGEDPVRLEGAAPKLEHAARDEKGTGERKAPRKHANTMVPPKAMNPRDMFMSGKAAAYDDAYDAYDDPPEDGYEGAFAFDDEEEGGFLQRHLRGLVSLALLVILLLLFVIYAFSRSGQLTLARANLAWSTDAYSQLGYQSYQDQQYSLAGQYYERALQRDADNYSFASSAAMAYFEAGETEKSAAMLKRCIEINPTLLEPYVYLLRLYPDAAQRPWDVTQLLQQGYQQTGDVRLNVTG